VDITPPIMSRFDLFFILQAGACIILSFACSVFHFPALTTMQDDCNEAVDKDIAQHLVRLHQRKQEAVTPPISKEMLQRYRAFVQSVFCCLS
jgi:DNA replication licensing factor MCM6